jgi:thiamine pyrophosphokinase
VPAAPVRDDRAAIRRVVVLIGGDPVDAPLARSLPSDAMIVAADGGLALARTLHLDVDLVVGDLDSVDPRHLAEAEAAGVPVDRHPVDKDRTDLAIALDVAARIAGTEPRVQVTVVGGHGGRLDHLVANSLLLASPAYAALDPVAVVGPAVATVVRGEVALQGRPGELVSLLVPHGDAHGVSTRGLRFPLDGESLTTGSSRGVSNEFTGTDASVVVDTGVLLAVQPGDQVPEPTG